MRKNPVVPYAIIALLGVLTVVVISVVGLGQRADIQQAEEGGEQTEQGAEEGQEGETAGGDAEAVFQSNCSACHGADLSGGAGPDLTAVGSKYSADEIAEIIQNGRGAMPPQSQVAGEELSALSQWLSEKQ
ncbi:cytochrome c550 [Oceanobacillus massiliensis]|uniref:cytochrome c550 n=1 Tax=Oceanobacillus massiliensis TaxID=1465765 RepID=UPI000287D4C4|nr:cytochrome c [Oceanobacillus massiliensis]